MMTTHHAYPPVVETPSPEANDKALVAQIAAAYFSHNLVPHQHIPDVLRNIKDGLAGKTVAPVEELKPVVPIKRSVQPDFIVCLEDGKKFKSLKRHLFTHYNLTPDQYREKWGLPADYPMVAPNYAEQRSALAKRMGLGMRQKPEPVVGVSLKSGLGRGRSTRKRETASAAA